MNHRKKALLAAAMLAAAAMTGCAANTKPAVTFTPPVQQQTAQPESTQSEQTPQPSPEETPEQALLPLEIDGEQIEAQAVVEHGELLLPLTQTAKALGWKVQSEDVQEETQLRRSVSMEKDGSRISVTWTVSDNTARQIVWQKDGLLIPVDTSITTMEDVVYVPAAFFETAMDVRVSRDENAVRIALPQEKATPETDAQEG